MKPLRLIQGQGITPAARADFAEAEVRAVHDEARAHCARMRLVLQLRFWDSEPWSAVRRPLLAELDRYERKVSEGDAA